MYAGRDFTDQQPGEDENFAFDFVNSLWTGEVILTGGWTVEYYVDGAWVDANSRKNDVAAVDGTMVVQNVLGVDADSAGKYRMTGIANTNRRQNVKLWAHCNVVVPT